MKIFFLGPWSQIIVFVERDRNDKKIFVSVFRFSIEHDKTSTYSSSYSKENYNYI